MRALQILKHLAARHRPLDHLDRAVGGRERGHAALEQIEDEESADGRNVDAADGRDDAAEQVEIGVGDGEDRLQQPDALRLREPREEDADGDQALVESEEVETTLNNNDCARNKEKEEYQLSLPRGDSGESRARRLGSMIDLLR